jgi:hypothetical protein
VIDNRFHLYSFQAPRLSQPTVMTAFP